jgi:hypothetical protein
VCVCVGFIYIYIGKLKFFIIIIVFFLGRNYDSHLYTLSMHFLNLAVVGGQKSDFRGSEVKGEYKGVFFLLKSSGVCVVLFVGCGMSSVLKMGLTEFLNKFQTQKFNLRFIFEIFHFILFVFKPSLNTQLHPTPTYVCSCFFMFTLNLKSVIHFLLDIFFSSSIDCVSFKWLHFT